MLEDLAPDALEMMRGMLLAMDPPRHTRYRLLVSRAFTPRHIRDLDLFIQRSTHRIVDEVIDALRSTTLRGRKVNARRERY